MKNNILNILTCIALLFGMSACHSPEEYEPEADRHGITNITASFFDRDEDDNSFKSEIDYKNKIITVVIPYNYPILSDNVVTLADIKDMRVIATLGNNCSVSPKLFRMDLSKENKIEVTNAFGEKDIYVVKGEIRKSAECFLTEFSVVLDKNVYSGIIKTETNEISIITLDEIGFAKAKLRMSHGATIEPDPRVKELDFDKEVTLTVTAQNGTDKTIYTVKKGVPQKVASGIRKGSAKLLWTTKLADLGLSNDLMVNGIAALNDYVVIHERNSDSAIYLDAKTGAVSGSMDLSEASGHFYMTADDNNNIVVSNLTGKYGAPDFKLYKYKDVSSAAEELTSFTTSAELGRKISICGSIDGNAIISAPAYGVARQFYTWQFKDGEIQYSKPGKPNWNMIKDAAIGGWGINCDIVLTNPTDLHSDLFASFYAEPRKFAMVDGKSLMVKSWSDKISPNWVPNAVDYVVFNKIGYALHNSVNGFSWGSDDKIYLYDVSSGVLGAGPIDFGSSGVDVNGKYGAKSQNKVNSYWHSDVAFKVSDNGFYLNIYFMFGGGYVGCVQCDCIDM